MEVIDYTPILNDVLNKLYDLESVLLTLKDNVSVSFKFIIVFMVIYVVWRESNVFRSW